MGRATAGVVFAAAVSCVGACSSFTAAEDSDAGDAATLAADANVPDAPATFCSAETGVKLCADFDGTGDVNVGWSGEEVSNMGALGRSLVAESAPSSLSSHVGTASDTVVSTARLYQIFDQTLTRTRISFDIRMATPALPENNTRLSIVEFLCYTTGSSPQSDGAFLSFRTSGASPMFVLETQAGKLTPVGAPVGDEWTHYQVDAHWDTKTVFVTVGTSGPVAAPLDACASFAGAHVNLGLSLSYGIGMADALYDNVVYEENPQ